MFFHKQELQFAATPDKPDAIFARRLQEVLGGQYGEITVAMQYGFQAVNCHLPGKYRDLLYGIGAEEMGHVEMLAVMIAQLLEKAPVSQSEEAVASDPTLAAVAFVPSTATATRGRGRTSPPAATSSPTSPPTPTRRCRAAPRWPGSTT